MTKVIRIFRNNRREVFCKKGVLKNFTKFTGKHLCQSLFYDKVAVLRPQALAQVFLYEFFKISISTFFTEHLWTTASEYLLLILSFFKSFEKRL